jgi:hypothetical protein
VSECCLQVASGGSEVAKTSTLGMQPSGLLASMLSSCVCVFCDCRGVQSMWLLVNERSYPPLAYPRVVDLTQRTARVCSYVKLHGFM